MFVCFISLIEQQLGQKNMVSKAYFKRRATAVPNLNDFGLTTERQSLQTRNLIHSSQRWKNILVA